MEAEIVDIVKSSWFSSVALVNLTSVRCRVFFFSLLFLVGF